jgi:DNA-binding NarL/FixJ family response regulator
MDNLETLRTNAADPAISGAHVVVVTTFEIDQYAFEAPQAGARGFILNRPPGGVVRLRRFT